MTTLKFLCFAMKGRLRTPPKSAQPNSCDQTADSSDRPSRSFAVYSHPQSWILLYCRRSRTDDCFIRETSRVRALVSGGARLNFQDLELIPVADRYGYSRFCSIVPPRKWSQRRPGFFMEALHHYIGLLKSISLSALLACR